MLDESAPTLTDEQPDPVVLFRSEVAAARTRRLSGDILLAQPLSSKILCGSLVGILLILLIFIYSCHISQTEQATGSLQPDNGIFKITAPSKGVIDAFEVKVGDQVLEGQSLAHIFAGRFDGPAGASDAEIRQELLRQLASFAKQEEILHDRNELERNNLEQAKSSASTQKDNAERTISLIKDRVALASDKLARAERGMNEGLISKVQLLEVRDQYLQLEQQSLAASREKSQAELVLRQAEEKIAQLPFDQMQGLDALREKQSQTKEHLAQVELDSGLTINCPHRGRVAAVLVHPGEMVQINTTVLVIVDDESPLQGRLLLPSRAMGSIRPGQQVHIKLDAFPFQRFGYQSGTVLRIAGLPLPAGEYGEMHERDGSTYEIIVSLDHQTIHANGADQPLTAGMTLNADIVVDTPRIVDWILEPDVRK